MDSVARNPSSSHRKVYRSNSLEHLVLICEKEARKKLVCEQYSNLIRTRTNNATFVYCFAYNNLKWLTYGDTCHEKWCMEVVSLLVGLNAEFAQKIHYSDFLTRRFPRSSWYLPNYLDTFCWVWDDHGGILLAIFDETQWPTLQPKLNIVFQLKVHSLEFWWELPFR